MFSFGKILKNGRSWLEVHNLQRVDIPLLLADLALCFEWSNPPLRLLKQPHPPITSSDKELQLV